MARPGATHRAAAPSCTPATRDPRRPAPPRRSRASGRSPEPRPTRWFRAGVFLPAPDRPGSAGSRLAARPSRSPVLEPGGIRASRPGSRSPCAVTLDQFHRQGDGLRAAGTTDSDASTPRQSRKTLGAHIMQMRALRRMPSDARSNSRRDLSKRCETEQEMRKEVRPLPTGGG
jgi:hypothetical protein